MTALPGRYCYYPHLTDKKTEAQSKVILFISGQADDARVGACCVCGLVSAGCNLDHLGGQEGSLNAKPFEQSHNGSDRPLEPLEESATHIK